MSEEKNGVFRGLIDDSKQSQIEGRISELNRRRDAETAAEIARVRAEVVAEVEAMIPIGKINEQTAAGILCAVQEMIQLYCKVGLERPAADVHAKIEYLYTFHLKVGKELVKFGVKGDWGKDYFELVAITPGQLASSLLDQAEVMRIIKE